MRAAGHRASDQKDIDLQFDESFYVDIILATSRFEKLLKQLQEPSAKLFILVQFGGIPRFLAQWLPSISEGRTIKFLDRTDDVSNSEDIPEGFFKPRSEEDEFEDPIKASIRVYNSLKDSRAPHERQGDVQHPAAIEEYDAENDVSAETDLRPSIELKHEISLLVQSLHKLRSSFRLWMILLVLATLLTGSKW